MIPNDVGESDVGEGGGGSREGCNERQHERRDSEPSHHGVAPFSGGLLGGVRLVCAPVVRSLITHGEAVFKLASEMIEGGGGDERRLARPGSLHRREAVC